MLINRGREMESSEFWFQKILLMKYTSLFFCETTALQMFLYSHVTKLYILVILTDNNL